MKSFLSVIITFAVLFVFIFVFSLIFQRDFARLKKVAKLNLKEIPKWEIIFSFLISLIMSLILTYSAM